MNAYVSIIIPLHNEAHRLRETVLKVFQWCEHNLLGRYEIILVDNGSTDDTNMVAMFLDATYRPVYAYHLQERSKAQAVKFGMLHAVGEYRYMCDVDLSAPIRELTKFLKATHEGYDVIVGSREHRNSEVETSFKRWFIGRVFHLLVLAFTGLHYHDTQCGFKLFNGRAAEKIFSRVQCTSMAFDVEVLYIADKLGYYATEIPITWCNDNDSRVRILRDSWSMLRELVQIRKRHQRLSLNEIKTKLPA